MRRVQEEVGSDTRLIDSRRPRPVITFTRSTPLSGHVAPPRCEPWITLREQNRPDGVRETHWTSVSHWRTLKYRLPIGQYSVLTNKAHDGEGIMETASCKQGSKIPVHGR